MRSLTGVGASCIIAARALSGDAIDPRSIDDARHAILAWADAVGNCRIEYRYSSTIRRGWAGQPGMAANEAMVQEIDGVTRILGGTHRIDETIWREAGNVLSRPVNQTTTYDGFSQAKLRTDEARELVIGRVRSHPGVEVSSSPVQYLLGPGAAHGPLDWVWACLLGADAKSEVELRWVQQESRLRCVMQIGAIRRVEVLFDRREGALPIVPTRLSYEAFHPGGEPSHAVVVEYHYLIDMITPIRILVSQQHHRLPREDSFGGTFDLAVLAFEPNPSDRPIPLGFPEGCEIVDERCDLTYQVGDRSMFIAGREFRVHDVSKIPPQPCEVIDRLIAEGAITRVELRPSIAKETSDVGIRPQAVDWAMVGLVFASTLVVLVVRWVDRMGCRIRSAPSKRRRGDGGRFD